MSKSLFFGGVTHRFPDLLFRFLEGGASWGITLYARLVEHWKKRNHEAMQRLDLARIDTVLFDRLIDEFGHERLKPHRDQIIKNVALSDRTEELDDWRDCQNHTLRANPRSFRAQLFFGCEGDDRSAAAAFDRRMNPYGVALKPMFGFDIGSFRC